MPSYNHALYIGRAIQSVLDQSFTDYEFLISDDGSQDNTRDIVAQFNDKRIKFFDNRENRGACIVHNELLAQSTGEYIALINSDDMWVKNKLSQQVAFLDKNPNIGAHFSRVTYIDAQDTTIQKEDLPFGSVFDQPNRTQAEWVRYFFDKSNCLCHPSSLIRRECYEKLGGYNNNLRQLPDFDMWVRLVKQYSIFIEEEPLVYFRILSGENASAPTTQNHIRIINEHYLIGEHFFDDMPDQIFEEAFSDQLRPLADGKDRDIVIDQMLQYFDNTSGLSVVYIPIGLRKLFELMGDPKYQNILADAYGINNIEFQNKFSNINIFLPDLVPEITIKQRVMRKLRAWLSE